MIRALAGLVAAALLLSGCGGQPRAQVAPTPPASPTPAPTAAAVTVARAVPVRLAIPLIGVDAEVEEVGTGPDGFMATPSKTDAVGWWSPGASPGDGNGDVVIDGHFDSATGPAVFTRLHELAKGAAVTVTLSDGRAVSWTVSSNTRVAATARPSDLFAATGPLRLTLVTCSGHWDGHHYSLRRLVTALPA